MKSGIKSRFDSNKNPLQRDCKGLFSALKFVFFPKYT